MNRLSTYVLVIHSLHPQVRVVSHTEQQSTTINEDEFIEEESIIYTFDNDVKILFQTEKYSFQPDQICKEFWISYQVLESGKHSISPKRKQFYNRCQEAFWLKMQLIHKEPNS